jgi:hypothetical protein
VGDEPDQTGTTVAGNRSVMSCKTLCQFPLAIRGMLARSREREAKRRRNRAYFRQFFGLERKTHSCRLGTGELCESNLPLR